MYGLDTHEWLATFCFAIAGLSIIAVVMYEMIMAHREKKAFDEKYEAIYLLRHEHMYPSEANFKPRKDEVYDWKKDARNDFS